MSYSYLGVLYGRNPLRACATALLYSFFDPARCVGSIKYAHAFSKLATDSQHHNVSDAAQRCILVDHSFQYTSLFIPTLFATAKTDGRVKLLVISWGRDFYH